MALSRSVQLSATCVATLFALAIGGLQAEEGQAAKPFEYQDVRIGWAAAPTPSVRSEARDGGGAFNYDGGESRGSRFTLTYLRGSAIEQTKVGTVFGGQFSFGTYSIGSGGNVVNLSQPMVDLYYGWQYGVVDTPSLRGWLELLPFIGLGGSITDVDGKNRLGYAVEGGLRAGAYLSERSWMFGLTASGLIGTSKVKGDVNELRLNTNGFTFGAEVGYRF